MSLAAIADHMASKGRGPDSMLIHMSPREVQGLQALAMKHGGSLTINPETGLPEAGFLDKLLPAIIGFALGPAGFALATPMQAAMVVGGIQAARTGDIGKGIQAGLGAYGGAGIGAGMTEAGAANIGAGEAAKGLTMTPELANELMNAGAGETAAATNNALQQQVAERMATATPYEKLSAGMDVAKANPMGMTKSLATPLMMAAAPILADQAVKANMPTTTTKPGMIRPYSFDPYGGTYTAGTPYEAAPTRSAEGGLMGLAAGGMAGYGDGDDVPRRVDSGGMFDFTQRSEPVVRMAEGGIAHFVLGGEVKGALEAAYAANDVNKINEIARSNMVTAADIADTYKGFDTSGIKGLQLYTPPNMENSIKSMLADQKAGGDGTGNRTPTYTQYTDEQMGSFLSNPVNKDIDLQKAIKDTNADPAAVNRYIASLTSPFKGSTESDRGSGTFGIYNNMVNQSISPDEYYAAAVANNPKYAGWTKDMIQEGYNLNKGMYALSDAKKGVVTDTDWAKLMVGNGTWDKPQYDPNEMAQATGLSIAEVRARYELEKAKDGTITTRPNIPGIPVGGFTGMTSLRDAYEKGGGSLGYVPYTPKTIDEFNAKYKNTGGSKAAYDYLMGKTPYSPIPYTPTGEIQKPYFESVGRAPVNLKTKRYIFQTDKDGKNGKYVLNPDFVKPPYVLAAEKAAAGKETTKTDVAAGKSIDVTDYQGNAEKAYLRDDGLYYTSGGNKFNEKGVQVAAGGGLMAMARGGVSQQFDLGGYSDGGRLLRGPGDGVSDSIPATIGNKRPARLADGEFVVPARIVSELGNGSTEAGARKLYAMMDRVQNARRKSIGKGKVANNSRAEKYLPA